jgi:hypothetical protein
VWTWQPRVLGKWFPRLFSLLFVPACGSPSSVGEQSARVIYGTDDRREVYEIESAEVRERVSRAVVALVPATAVDDASGTIHADALGERMNFCDAEPFEDQPSVAFCTGVLVDWDLILTAGHCGLLYSPAGMRAVFGWHYRAPGELATSSASIYGISEIVSEAIDPAGASPRLDFSWMRLSRPVSAPLEPIAVALGTAVQDEPLSVAGASFGLPLKVDQAATVKDARLDIGDYFVSDSDTSHGASGAPAFDSRLAVLGVLARGGSDGSMTEDGCFETAHQPEERAEEHFTYAREALRALCDEGYEGSTSTLCRAECEDPCEALPLAAATDEGGCNVAGGGKAGASAALFVAACLGLSFLGRRAARSSERQLPIQAGRRSRAGR